MREMSIKEIQDISLEILKYIDVFCKEHGIRYFLDSGTLLGAARHKGFIPWDDDMDIRLPRPDYERFVKEFVDTRQYKLYAPQRGNSYLSYARVCEMQKTLFRPRLPWTFEAPGVGVDVLPLDGTTDSLVEYENISKQMNRELRRLVEERDSLVYTPHFRKTFLGFLRDCGHYLINKMYRLNFRYFTKNTFRKIERLRTKYRYEDEKFCFGACLRMSLKGRWLHEWFSDVVYLDFCDGKFPVPIGYDQRLTAEYGDWRTPPPDTERLTHEKNQTMWWRD